MTDRHLHDSHNTAAAPAQLLAEVAKTGHEALLLREPLVVGVSGGADSLALLHLLVELRGARSPATLHVAHLDHRFRGDEGAQDALFVQQAANSLGLPCTCAAFDVPTFAHRHHLSPEEAARRVRYAFLAGAAHKVAGMVTVAHNRDDQAETVLLHLLRGAGISGLAGMKALGMVPIAQGYGELGELLHGYDGASVEVFRPLLGVSRAQIEAYCVQKGVIPRHDATNSDPRYRRNLVRNILLPALGQASPSVQARLADLAQLAAAEDDLLESLLETAWQHVAAPVGEGGVSVECAAFRRLPLALQRRLVRRAIRQVGGTLDNVSFRHVERALEVLGANRHAPAAIDLPHSVTVRRHGNTALIARHGATPAGAESRCLDRWPCMEPGMQIEVQEGMKATLTGGWTLSVEAIEAASQRPRPGLYTALFDADTLQQLSAPLLRTRRPGDFLRPLGMQGHRSLQDVLVDAKIPREARPCLPLLALTLPSSELLWVPGPGGRRSYAAPIVEGSASRVLCIRFWKDAEPEK